MTLFCNRDCAIEVEKWMSLEGYVIRTRQLFHGGSEPLQKHESTSDPSASVS